MTCKKINEGLVLYYLRCFSQLAVVVAAAATGYRFAQGFSLTTVEKYCPMGGAATSYSLGADQRFSCATGEYNFSLLLALLVLTLLVRKSFCSWLCPVGTVSEWIGSLVGRVRGKKGRRTSGTDIALLKPPVAVNSWLGYLRYGVLGVVLYATIYTGELMFRPFCPYYVMFSLHGHEVQMWSYAILGFLLLGVIIIPMLWCRYLCPLGGLLSPFSKVGLLRIRRKPDVCVDCGACDMACGHSIPVAKCETVTSGECTLCLSCVRSCPVDGALEVSATGRWSVPASVVPVAVAVLLVAGLYGGRMYAVPSFAREYAAASSIPERMQEARFIVRGVRCVDTAILAATVFEDMDGIRRFTAYASRNEVLVEYDAAVIDVKMLVTLLEGPVYMEGVDEFVFGVYEVLEINGNLVSELKQKGETQ
jgi:ferredoxin